MTCPTCGSDSDQKYRPFCSARCADIDLGKWMRGAYRVPSDDPEDLDRAAEEAARATEDKSRPH